MKLSQLTLIVTDDCNFRCIYCPQKKEEAYMKLDTIEKALTFFYPFLEEEASIFFIGGEPLLAIQNIKHAVTFLMENNVEKKAPLFSLTTNGSLLTDEILDFLNQHEFEVLLSFDGLNQGKTRKLHSSNQIMRIIRHIQDNNFPNIKFSTNSVFTPDTIDSMSSTLQSIIDAGVPEVEYSLALNFAWNESSLSILEEELESLCGFLVSYFERHSRIPVSNFNPERSTLNRGKEQTLFGCTGGNLRMAISPDRDVWGCHVFHDYFKNKGENTGYHTYCFGKLEDFSRDYERIYPGVIKNYKALRQDLFFTDSRHCITCDDFHTCRVCPVSAAYSSLSVGRIPKWNCNTNRIQNKIKTAFFKKIAANNA